MLQHPTLDLLRQLKLHGMARAFAELRDNPQAGELDHAQWLALLLDREEAERNDRRLTYRLRNARLRHAATLITSQLPLPKWHDVIGEPTFADAILDRIVHNAHRIDLDGPSMRKITADKNGSTTIDRSEGK